MGNIISYEEAALVLQDPVILVAIGLVWFLPLVLMFIIGATVRARTSGGRGTGRMLWQHPNFWYFPLVMLVQLFLFVLLVLPVWLRAIS